MLSQKIYLNNFFRKRCSSGVSVCEVINITKIIPKHILLIKSAKKILLIKNVLDTFCQLQKKIKSIFSAHNFLYKNKLLERLKNLWGRPFWVLSIRHPSLCMSWRLWCCSRHIQTEKFLHSLTLALVQWWPKFLASGPIFKGAAKKACFSHGKPKMPQFMVILFKIVSIK